MPKTALTDLSIKHLPAPPRGQQTYWDATVQGLGVRVSQGGAKAFVVLLGSGQRKTIGRYPAISLQSARSEAKLALLRAHEERISGAPKLPSLTVEEAIGRYLADCAGRIKPRTLKSYARILRKHLARHARTPLAAVSTPMVAGIMDRLRSTPVEAGNTLKVCKSFFNWCIRREYLERNPCGRLIGPKTRSRERVLTDQELAAVVRAAIRLGYPFGHIVVLLILTGLRRSEAASLRREWVNESDRTITLPAAATKNSRVHKFPFGQAVADLLESLPRDGEYLFPAAGERFAGEVMRAEGFRHFTVAGHDRGAQVAYRLALDFPASIDRVAILDNLPIFAVWDIANSTPGAVEHWRFLARPGEEAEREITETYLEDLTRAHVPDGSLKPFNPVALAAYKETWNDPVRLHAFAEDYRAGATTDLQDDIAARDACKTFTCPTVVIWGKEFFGKFDNSPIDVWKGSFAPHAVGIEIAGGHYVMEENPTETGQGLETLLTL